MHSFLFVFSVNLKGASRGVFIALTVYCAGTIKAVVPSRASTGIYEALEMRDKVRGL